MASDLAPNGGPHHVHRRTSCSSLVWFRRAVGDKGPPAWRQSLARGWHEYKSEVKAERQWRMPHLREMALQRQLILNRVVDAMVSKRGQIVSDIERHELRDAVQIAYESIQGEMGLEFKAAKWHRRVPPGRALRLGNRKSPAAQLRLVRAKSQIAALVARPVRGHAEIKQFRARMTDAGAVVAVASAPTLAANPGSAIKGPHQPSRRWLGCTRTIGWREWHRARRPCAARCWPSSR